MRSLLADELQTVYSELKRFLGRSSEAKEMLPAQFVRKYTFERLPLRRFEHQNEIGA